MPCKNCNIETRCGDYAAVDEAVFFPCRGEASRADPSRASLRITSPSFFSQVTAINTWITRDRERLGKGHVTVSTVTQQLKRFPAWFVAVIGVIGDRSESVRSN
jgi:hypothetical protein